MSPPTAVGNWKMASGNATLRLSRKADRSADGAALAVAGMTTRTCTCFLFARATVRIGLFKDLARREVLEV